MTEDIRKALLDLRSRQESGEHMPCPRCGRDTMYENLYTNALSREADGIYVCSDCGSNESVLSFMNNPLPVDDWAIFNPDKHDMDFKDIPGEQAWAQIQKEQTRILEELYVRWLAEKAGADFKRQFTLDSYKEFFADAGFNKAEYTFIDGRIPCALAVITIEKEVEYS